jgi:hypothetical protein
MLASSFKFISEENMVEKSHNYDVMKLIYHIDPVAIKILISTMLWCEIKIWMDETWNYINIWF